MGTRNLTCVILDNEFKVAQYGQWDGYLDGQGTTIMKFLEDVDREKFTSALRACRFLSEEEVMATWTACGADPANPMVSLDIAEVHDRRFPGLSRDTGAKVLTLIQDGTVRELDDQHGFAGDSLSCEYAYVLDCDNGYLEIYRGFNRGPLSPDERFFGYPTDNAGYHPIKLWRKIPFADCNPKAIGHLQAEESHEYELSEQEE